MLEYFPGKNSIVKTANLQRIDRRPLVDALASAVVYTFTSDCSGLRLHHDEILDRFAMCAVHNGLCCLWSVMSVVVQYI